MSTSTHQVEVVPVTLEPHPNADSLSIVRVYGYTVCVRTSDWQGVERGAYIPPDSVVPDAPAFAFLNGHRRIRAKRLRGIVSMGLLVPAPADAALGDDVAEALGVVHYEPAMLPGVRETEDASAPPGYHPTYDVDSLRRYAHLFTPGEIVWISEKIHGANSRYVFVDGVMHAGSRTRWKKQDPRSIWWQALDATPALAEFCEAHPGVTVYGEVYGQVQDLKYGVERGVRFAAFDVLTVAGAWLDPADAHGYVTAHGVPWVPTLPVQAFDLARIEALANGPSLLCPAHCREGVVVRPIAERRDDHLGRVHLKMVGTDYLERP